jgi:hypothetical protein
MKNEDDVKLTAKFRGSVPIIDAEVATQKDQLSLLPHGRCFDGMRQSQEFFLVILEKKRTSLGYLAAGVEIPTKIS